jgi:hypothetical protein
LRQLNGKVQSKNQESGCKALFSQTKRQNKAKQSWKAPLIDCEVPQKKKQTQEGGLRSSFQLEPGSTVLTERIISF